MLSCAHSSPFLLFPQAVLPLAQVADLHLHPCPIQMTSCADCISSSTSEMLLLRMPTPRLPARKGLASLETQARWNPHPPSTTANWANWDQCCAIPRRIEKWMCAFCVQNISQQGAYSLISGNLWMMDDKCLVYLVLNSIQLVSGKLYIVSLLAPLARLLKDSAKESILICKKFEPTCGLDVFCPATSSAHSEKLWIHGQCITVLYICSAATGPELQHTVSMTSA